LATKSEQLKLKPERQTDMTKLIVAFGNFSNAPKNWLKTRAKY